MIMRIITVVGFLCLLRGSLATEVDGTPCKKEGAVMITRECERVYVCKPHEDSLIWCGFTCSNGAKPDPTGTECLENQCGPATFKPTGELNSTPKPGEIDCAAVIPKENDWGLLEDPEDCTNYYYCWQAYTKVWNLDHVACAKDQHFYPYIGYCLNGGCPKDVLPSTPPPPDEPFKCEDYLPYGQTAFVADPHNCRMYYKCSFENGKWTIYPIECPAGQHYNVIGVSCYWGECPEETLIVGGEPA